MHIIKTYTKIPTIILLLLTIYPITKTNIDFNKTTSKNSLVFVSLGLNCEPALMLRNLGVRMAAYPFDWNVTMQLSAICNMIKNNFKDFLNPLLLKHNGATIKNTLYNTEFKHDFPYLSPYGPTNVPDFDLKLEKYLGGPIVDNFLDFLPAITEKYMRRINRFMKLLNSTKNVVFIRTHLMPEEAKQFVALMATHYPNLNYRLIGLQKNNNIIFELEQLPSVKIYYTQTKNTDPNFPGWIQLQEWRTIIADIISNN